MSDLESQIYSAKDICRLFDCGANEIPRLLSEGTIPKPLPAAPRARRRWSRAAVNKKLGIVEPIVPEEELRRIITDVVKRMFGGVE